MVSIACFTLLLLAASATRAEEAPRDPAGDGEGSAPVRHVEPGVLQAEAARAGEVFEIRIEGTRRAEPDRVAFEVQGAIGRPIDAKRIRDDVRRVYGMGVFTDVTVEARPGPQGSIVLVYRVEERPLMRRIDVVGNKAISRSDIDGVVDVKPGEILDLERLAKNAAKIRDLYKDKGFHHTDVTFEVRPSTAAGDADEEKDALQDLAARVLAWVTSPTKGEGAKKRPVPKAGEGVVDVLLQVDEGHKVKVQELKLVGNEDIPDDVLRELVRTKKDVPLAELLGWGLYRDDFLQFDVMAIEALYQDRGYLDVKVGPPDVKLSPEQDRARITIPIEEGTQYRIGRVTVDGDLVVDDGGGEDGSGRITFDRSRLLARFGLAEGDVASRSKLAAGVDAVARSYRDRGYAYVNVTPEPRVRKEAGALDLALQIDAGPRVKVERIEIVGNTKTRDHVLRREFRLYEGEWFSAEQLKRSEARVRALGYFEEVSVTTRRGSEPDRMVVTVEVKDKSTGKFQLGAGFSNAESFMVNGMVAYDNFLGLGQMVSASAQLSSLRRMFDLRFTDPYFLTIGEELISFSFSAFNTQRGYTDFLRNATGLNATLGYPVGRPFRFLTERLAEDAPGWLRPYVPDLENFHLYVAANVERVHIDSSGKDLLPGFDLEKPRYTTGLEAALVFDQRNNRLFPSAGYFLQARAEVVTLWLGGGLLPDAEARLQKVFLEQGWREAANALSGDAVTNDFQRFSVNGRFYFNFDEWLPIRGVVAKANVELGYVRSDEDLPFENYYAGGMGTVRGYHLRSISPQVEVAGDGPDDPARYVRYGGNKQFIANLELEFPVVEQLGIRGVVFFDAGNVYSRDESLFYLGMPASTSTAEFDARRDLPLGLYTSVGFGVRWFSPIGPLRFEWGIPLTPRPRGTPGLLRGDEPILFEFNIGGSF